MTASPHHIDPTAYVEELLTQASPDLMRQMLGDFINHILSAQADTVCGADYGNPNVVGIFSNHDAVIRLVGAVLTEQHDDWIPQNRYMLLTSLEMTKAVMNADVLDDTTDTKEIAA